MSGYALLFILTSVFAVAFVAGLLVWTSSEEVVKGQEEVKRQEEETRQEPVDEEVGGQAVDKERMDEEAVGEEKVKRENVPEQLRELAKLREEGILTEEEYEAKRKQLVDEL